MKHREPNKRELFAMLFWHKEYAAQACGAIEFYRWLSASEKRLVQDCLRQLKEAPGRWPTREDAP